jgi:hypothetical protein
MENEKKRMVDDDDDTDKHKTKTSFIIAIIDLHDCDDVTAVLTAMMYNGHHSNDVIYTINMA